MLIESDALGDGRSTSNLCHENPEQNCYKLLFAVMYCIGNVVHPIQNSHSVITWYFSYSTLNIAFLAEPLVQCVVCRLSITFCIVAKWCVLAKKCLKE